MCGKFVLEIPHNTNEEFCCVANSHTQLITLYSIFYPVLFSLGHYRFFVPLSQEKDSALKDVMVWHMVFGTADVSRKELKISALNRVLLDNLLVAYFANFPQLLCLVTVRRILFKISISCLLIIKPTRCINISNLFLDYDSTCFGRFLRPSSGVYHCTYSNRHMPYRFYWLLASKQSAKPVPIAVCTVLDS